MLVVWLILLSLLAVAALGLALVLARRSERVRVRQRGELAELREKILSELSELRARVEWESRRAATNQSSLSELEEAVGDLRLAAASGDANARPLRGASAAPRESSTAEEGAAAGEENPSPDEHGFGLVGEDAVDLFSLARGFEPFFNQTIDPSELLGEETFERGVRASLAAENTTGVLLARGSDAGDVIVGCMSLEALARRAGDDEQVVETVLKEINNYFYWPRLFALRALAAHAGDRPVLARLLARLNSSWRDYTTMKMLRGFAASRAAAGDAGTAGELMAEVRALGLDAGQMEDIAQTVEEAGEALHPSLGAELSRWRAERETVEFIKTFGRVWETGGASAGDVFVLDELAARVAELEAAIKREPPRSVILAGDAGTGKTSLVRALAERLGREQWVVFEAGAADVLAGQQYIGQLEERVQSIVRQIKGRRVLWVVPNFHEMMWAGRHKYTPVGILDLLLPHVESGAVRLVGEVPSDAYEQLVRLRPKLRTAMQTCRLAPSPDEVTLELGRRWAAKHGRMKHAWAGMHEGVDTSYTLARASEQTLREALQLAKQYLGDKAAPGNLLTFLDAAHRRLLAEGADADEVSLDDLLVTLSQLTGLPVSILDEREGLDLSELRAFFERRVLGQPEAVECLVERVALIKAGLTDPTRPQGVFLFVGPTGTGKTEIAKTLAEFLFGSPDRMIRLDMSELQTWDSQARILGEAEETAGGAALVNLIRKQPFSVVLLDEFEKAHPAVWDLFLQVFDDGRLTDRRGNTADFRHSVIILTSNLGATLPHGASIGFSQEQAQFAAGSVERAVGRAFRREFVNRIDRVVVFRPLGRAVMRELLRKELNDVLQRRGLRTRQWAVEWDESAVEFLLDRGFTADLGARPLKRAVERYLLSPLALTIVNHQFPEGDQFLLLRSSADGETLDVQFVDPDADAGSPAPEGVEAETYEEGADAGRMRLESVALDPRGAPEEVLFLREKYDEVASLVDDEGWAARKEEAMRQMQSADFWNSPARFSVLGLVEYMDRIEAGLDTAGSLLARLRGERKRLPPDLVGRLAQRLYLLESACRGLSEGEPRDAFLLIQASREAGAERAVSDEFARRLSEMYRRWAERRRMRFEVLEEQGGAQGNGAGASEYRAVVAVSGYAAYTILSRETGLHVLETPQDEKSFNRARALVRVVAQPEEPAGHGREALRLQAERALAEEAGAAAPVVRRYREEPSPLVRDAARGWRTGKLSRVLDGDFDLIT